LVPQPAKAAGSKQFDWRGTNAYTLGVQSYLYAFPRAYIPDARWSRTEAIDRLADRFHHIRKLEDAEHLNGGAPSNDTLYSSAWVYLKDEPVLSVPEIADRRVQMLAGFVANDPIEATFLNVSTEGDGKPLTGKHRYTIHFGKGGQPDVKAFW
jgi:hypothetical protein